MERTNIFIKYIYVYIIEYFYIITNIQKALQSWFRKFNNMKYTILVLLNHGIKRMKYIILDQD